jgi:putative oxidoreductase
MNPDRIAAACQPYLLSLFRFVTGLTMFQYGVAKLFKFPPVPMFQDVTPFSLVGVAGMLEFVLGGYCCKSRKSNDAENLAKADV